jgi:hypothetical protein
MKKIVVFAVLLIVTFSFNGCSSGGDEGQIINRITLVVDGITKRFTYVTIDQGDADFILIRGQIGNEVIETIELEIARNVTGTSAVNSMIFTQNNIEYYAFEGSGVYSNVTENGAERKLRGNFSGLFKTLSGGSKLISDGSFKVNY